MATWTDEKCEAELRRLCETMGHFPSANELRAAGHNALCCRITKTGGIIKWAERLGMHRAHSDSDLGWEGEIAFMRMLQARGFTCERSKAVKAPFDLLVEGVLRVDVKTARFASYGHSSGWFYRIGKLAQSDLVVLLKLDAGDFYALPWHVCTTSNMTITLTGKTYVRYLNNWGLIESMATTRTQEQANLKAMAS